MRVPTLQHFAPRPFRSQCSRWLISSVHVGSRISYHDEFKVSLRPIGRYHSTGGSTANAGSSWTEDARNTTPSTSQWNPLPDGDHGIADPATINALSQQSPFFSILCSAMGGATHKHLQQLAGAVIFPGSGTTTVVDRADALPAESSWNWNSRHIAAATERVNFGSTDATNLARELLAATLLAAKLGTRGPGVEQWARGLLAAALSQYRDIDGRLEIEDGADFGLKCFDMYAQMIDLLAAWNLFCERHQTAVENSAASYNQSHSYGYNPGGYVADIEAQKCTTYQQRLMSSLPGLSSWMLPYKVSTDCEQDLVFASFITLALMTKLRYRMLRGLDAGTRIAAAEEAGPGSGSSSSLGSGALASTDASLLNLRNVSLPEAGFLRLVGQAGQGTPFNRIHLRLVWARIGCSPAEAQSIGRTIENLHAYYDYLLMEADRSFSLATADAEAKAGWASTGAAAQEQEFRSGGANTGVAMAPAPLLAWIHYADAQTLRRFREGLSKSSSISVHLIWPELLSAITRRFIAIDRQQQQKAEDSHGSEQVAGDILHTLKVWVALGQSGPGGADALDVLDHFRDCDDEMSYSAAWSTLRQCQEDEWLERHFQHWVTHLWNEKDYDRVVSLHRKSVQLLSEKLSGNNDHACRLTQICLQLQVQNQAKGVHSQRIFHNLVRVGIEPGLEVWRQWIRVKLAASQFLNAVRALWRYKICEEEEEKKKQVAGGENSKGEARDLREEACIYLTARLEDIKADKRLLLKDILFDISRAVSIGLKQADCEKLYMLRKAGSVLHLPGRDQARVFSIHEQLVQRVCESPSLGAPNRLKVAAAIHMHLVRCFNLEQVKLSSSDLAARLTGLEETITAAFWKAKREEQMRIMCRQRFNGAWPPKWAVLPVVKSQQLVREWLARRLAQRKLSFDFDLGSAEPADMGTYLASIIDIVNKREKSDEGNAVAAVAAAAAAAKNAAVRKWFHDVSNHANFIERESLKRGARERKVVLGDEKEEVEKEVVEKEVTEKEVTEKEVTETKAEKSVETATALPIRHVALRRPERHKRT